MPMATYTRKPATTRTAIGLTTTAPTAVTYATAKAEAHGYADANDGYVQMFIDAAKAVTAYYFDTTALIWVKNGGTAALHTVSLLANASHTWQFPKGVLVNFTIDATTANMTTSMKVVS